MSFIASEEITAALQKGASRGSCKGVIIRYGDDGAEIALRGYGLSLRHGDRLHLRSQATPEKSAWARVEAFSLAGDVKLVGLTDLRFEGDFLERAVRFPVQIEAHAAPVDQPHRLDIGKTVNISLTGALIELPQEPENTENLHVKLQLEDGKFLEAIARVVRTTKTVNGCRVGLEFQRFVKGFDLLAALVQAE